MFEPTFSAGTVTTLSKEVIKCLRRLVDGSAKRQSACLDAIEKVVVGVRKTEAYCRARSTGNRNLRTEGDLAAMWTEIGFALQRVGVPSLAKRCDVKGRYWANSERFSNEWWDSADIGLDSVEALARRVRVQVKLHERPE